MSTVATPAADREPRHRWGEPVRLQARTERVCALCGLVKITMHPPRGYPWREWRHRAGASIPLTNTPPCLPQEMS